MGTMKIGEASDCHVFAGQMGPIAKVRLPHGALGYKIRERPEQFVKIAIRFKDRIEERILTVHDKSLGIYGVSEWAYQVNHKTKNVKGSRGKHKR